MWHHKAREQSQPRGSQAVDVTAGSSAEWPVARFSAKITHKAVAYRHSAAHEPQVEWHCLRLTGSSRSVIIFVLPLVTFAPHFRAHSCVLAVFVGVTRAVIEAAKGALQSVSSCCLSRLPGGVRSLLAFFFCVAQLVRRTEAAGEEQNTSSADHGSNCGEPPVHPHPQTHPQVPLSFRKCSTALRCFFVHFRSILNVWLNKLSLCAYEIKPNAICRLFSATLLNLKRN